MKLENSILIPVHCNADIHAYVFRMNIEHLLHYTKDEEFEEIIIVDDCSPSFYCQRYLEYLSSHNKIRIIRNGKPATSYYCRKKDINETYSLGHGASLTKGLDFVKTRYLTILDNDTLVLKEYMLRDALSVFEKDDKIVAVGQLWGKGFFDGLYLTSTEKIEKISTSGKIKVEGRRALDKRKGVINAVACVIDTKVWSELNFEKFHNGGWAHALLVKSILRSEYKMANFDFFYHKYLMHIGHISVSTARKKGTKIDDLRIRVGNSKDEPHYGGRIGNEIDNFFAGYAQFNMTSKEWYRWMQSKYSTLPFEERGPILTPEDLIYPTPIVSPL